MERVTAFFHRLFWRIRPPVVALGGGGARGFAHLGVLQVLDELGLQVRAVAGTSMGAVTGSMYLAYGSADAAISRWRDAIELELVPPVRPMRAMPETEGREHPLIQVARKIRNRVVVSFAMNRTTVLDDRDLVRAFEFLVPDMSIEDLPRPFLAVTTDLEDGREVRVGQGSLHRALKASSAIPGLLPAVNIDDRWLVDGAVVAEVPVAAARSLGWPVIAVDASMDVPPLGDDNLVLDTMMRTQMMTARLLRRRVLSKVRAVIRPPVGHAAWADWHEFDSLVGVGRRAAREFFGLPADPPAHPVVGSGL
jgi:NTE family protein